MPIKFRKKPVLGARPTIFSIPPKTSLAKNRRLRRKKKRKMVKNELPKITSMHAHDPALTVWDMLKPLHEDEKSIKIVLDCIGRKGMFEQTYVENPTMSVPEILKLAVAKFVLQTCNSVTPRTFHIKDFYHSSKSIEMKKEQEQIREKGPIIRPTFKERYEAKVLKLETNNKVIKYDVPKRVLKQYCNLMFEERLLKKLLRPQIYFDFDIRTDRLSYANVGRVVFQLFAEACPAIVLELVRSCSSNRFREMTVRKVFKNIWLEGEFRIDKSPVLEERFLTCNYCVLDHSMGPGIISFPKQIIYHNANREIVSFVIGFSPLKIPVTQPRIPFGVVHRGHYVLNELEKLGTVYGKPRSRLKISKCGAINV